MKLRPGFGTSKAPMKLPISRAHMASTRRFLRKETLTKSNTLTLVIPNEVRALQSAAKCRSLTSFEMTIHQSGGPRNSQLLTLRALVNDRQSRSLFRLLLCARPFAGFRRTADDVSDRGALQYLGRGISHLQKHTIERAMVGIGDDEAAELIRIPKGCEWPVNQTNDLAEFDLRWRAPQAVAALRASNAFHEGRVLEFQQNQLKKLLR